MSLGFFTKICFIFNQTFIKHNPSSVNWTDICDTLVLKVGCK